MVDDLNFLKRGGRISGSAALAGSIVHLKPILKGDEEGRLVLDQKMLGRKKALKSMVELFRQYHVANPENRVLGITHTDCEDEAHLLAADIVDFAPDVEVSVSNFEPCTASHVGPGFGGTVLLLSIDRISFELIHRFIHTETAERSGMGLRRFCMPCVFQLR